MAPGKSFVATPFPVHFCSKAVATVPYEHPDSAALRILAKLLSSKYLHSQIREKGGAYGGGRQRGWGDAHRTRHMAARHARLVARHRA